MRPLARTPRQKVRGPSAPRECGIAPRSRGGARVAQCKNRGTLKSVRATSGARRPLASTASTPDSKVTRQQASSKQCAGKRAASRGARADAKRARAEPGEDDEMVAGAEGACQERGAEHWQRHSCQPGAHLCCRCNFIKRKKEIKRDLPWCSPRPRFMGGHWRLGCDVCAWMAANLPGEMPGRRGREWRAGRFARYDFVFHGGWWQMNWLLKQHANESGHRTATLCHSGFYSTGSDEAVAELAASVGDEASRWRPCGRSSSEQ